MLVAHPNSASNVKGQRSGGKSIVWESLKAGVDGDVPNGFLPRDDVTLAEIKLQSVFACPKGWDYWTIVSIEITQTLTKKALDRSQARFW